MKVKNYSLDSAEFILKQHQYKGETVVAVHEINGKIYLFTPNHAYVAIKLRWYHRVWNWLRREG